MLRKILLSASMFSLTACTTMAPIVTPLGAADGAKGRAIAFIEAESAAKTEPARTKDMLSRGFELIRSNCREYFRSAGNNQFYVNFARDSTVAAAAVVTSGLLYNPRNKRVAGIIPLASGAIYTGMDVYNRNFLFSAENVGAVETLIMKAVTTHQNATIAQLGDEQPTYGDALNILQEDQTYCMPSQILPLVRSAIKKGDIVEVTPNAPPKADNRSATEVAVDEAVFKALGAELNPPSSVSLGQATALYWLFKSDAAPKERPTIATELTALPSGAQPLLSDGTFIAGWSHQKSVEDQLAKLSTSTVTQMRAAIQKVRDALAKGAATPTKSGSSTGAANPPAPAQMTRPIDPQSAPGPHIESVLPRARRPVEVDVR